MINFPLLKFVSFTLLSCVSVHFSVLITYVSVSTSYSKVVIIVHCSSTVHNMYGEISIAELKEAAASLK